MMLVPEMTNNGIGKDSNVTCIVNAMNSAIMGVEDKTIPVESWSVNQT